LIEHEVVEVFVGHAPVDMPLRANPDEVMATQWCRITNSGCTDRAETGTITAVAAVYLASHAEDDLWRYSDALGL